LTFVQLAQQWLAMKDKLDGKLALVTGAGSGIGKATALALAAKGARIVAVDIDDARVAEMKKELGTRCAMGKRVDVSKRDEMRALADDVHREVNLWGVIHGCHFFVPKMVERGSGGHVANVASAFGLFAGPGVAPYCTTKFAVVGLSESLRAELRPHGIGVSAICPGLINTDIIARGRFADEGMRAGVADTFQKKGRAPEQVASAILHAIAKNVAVVPVGGEAWAAWMGKRFAPGLTEIVGRRVEKAARAGRS